MVGGAARSRTFVEWLTSGSGVVAGSSTLLTGAASWIAFRGGDKSPQQCIEGYRFILNAGVSSPGAYLGLGV